MLDLSRSNDVNLLQAANALLLKENERLRAEKEAILKEMQALKQENGSAALQQELSYQQDLLKRREQELFGDSSERRPSDKARTEAGEKKPRKQSGNADQLRMVEQIHELPPEQRACDACGGKLVEMGDQSEDAEEISVLLKEFIRVLHRRRKYRCACAGKIVTAPGPVKLQPGGRYSVEFAVDLAVAKYCDHLPLARLVKIYERLGFTVTTQALWDQLDALATALWPTYLKLNAAVLKAPVVHADESYWRLMANGKEEENKRYWTWCVASEELVSYQILSARSAKAGKQVLGGYGGIVMADGYGVYQALAREGRQTALDTDAPAGFQLVNCWAHVRRKFVEAEPSFPKPCGEILLLIGELYEVERAAREGPPEEVLERRRRLRVERSRELVERIRSFPWWRSA